MFPVDLMDEYVRDCVYCQIGLHDRSAHILSDTQVDQLIAQFKAGKRPDKAPNWDRNY